MPASQTTPTTSASDFCLADIEVARARLAGAIIRTPCTRSEVLSQRTGVELFCKQEFLQRTGSFKERGARNALAALVEAEPGRADKGVIAASAGNHGLGLAWHGLLLGIPVTVVLPETAPAIKIERCHQFGASVVMHGDTFDEAREEAGRLSRQEGRTYIHPFDDLAVIAGQGTVALEILEQVTDLDAVLVPVGGGGLLAGVATALRNLRPDLQIIAVEPTHAACFAAGLAKGSPVGISTRPTFADGLAVAQVGSNTLRIAARLVDRVVSVEEEDIARAMVLLGQLENWRVEGAGAVGLAALLSGSLPELRGKRVVTLLTGGNVDPETYRGLW